MISKRIKSILAICLVSLLAQFSLQQFPVLAHPPMDNPLPKITLKDPCAQDPHNLIYDGSMAAGSPADGWSTFTLQGSPSFYHVDNEQIDPYGSVQIVSTGTFDAGLYQTVNNLQPGVYYGFRLGYSLAAKSTSGPNVRVQTIGRKVGVDPLGGTDPNSANVIWGPDFFNGQAALNIPEMQMIFAARAPGATIFLRAMSQDDSVGENRVWFDAVCMQAQTGMPTATPLAPTATPVTPSPTPTVPPTRARATRAPATEEPPTETQAPQATAASTGTAAPTTVALVVAAPATEQIRYARPEPTPAPGLPIDAGQGAMAGLGGLMFFGGLISFGIGVVLLKRT